MAINVSSAADRVFKSMEPEFERVCHSSAGRLAHLVESEIELMVLTTFEMLVRLSPLVVEVGAGFPADRRVDILLTPQFPWNEYRIDICVRSKRLPDKPIFVECDGHDFHERTKEQAERDRSKDRAIQAAGIPILRFTGREIWRDPGQVVLQILNFMGSR
jgi:very-short-patch-repair endonuclease